MFGMIRRPSPTLKPCLFTSHLIRSKFHRGVANPGAIPLRGWNGMTLMVNMFAFVSLLATTFVGQAGLSTGELHNPPTKRYMKGVYAQTQDRDASPSSKHQTPQNLNTGMKMGLGMEESGAEGMERMMGERMEDFFSPKGVSFYREKTFLVIITVILVLFIIWMVKRWGGRLRKRPRKPGPFVNEAILVVDLCESTKLAVTQGDTFAMRITSKMKACVREVSERFGASSFGNTGDGYLITFPTGASAVGAAVKILQNARDYNRVASEKEKIELRVGISYGELVLDEQGGRHGAAINKAFRIEGVKKDERRLEGALESHDFPEKNRILVSEEIVEEIKTLREIQFHELGVFDLRGFTGLHRVYTIPWERVVSD
jgi:class 3 adenylate cyclase